MTLAEVIGLPPRITHAVIGMVHLRALPGSPRWDGDITAVVRAALDDARALAEGGADALVVENHGDVPFTAGRVDAASVAGMTVAV
ncbi:MAG TPA: BtpA/SgcQ family protein, partial [Methylomirabilota bacterium]|nr:BtpA/SgcQ family protein [Methylomirabilota bacterium]